MQNLIEQLKQRSSKGIPTFLVVEGLDGSGKTTLAKQILCELLESPVPIISAREPGGTEDGEHIRKIIMDNNLCQTSTMLGMVLSRVLLNEQMLIPLMRGDYSGGKYAPVIVCDRYIRSTFAYQTASNDPDRLFYDHHIFELASDLHTQFIESGKIILPDLEIIMQVDYKTSTQRIRSRKLSELNRLDIVSDDNSEVAQKNVSLFDNRKFAMMCGYSCWMDALTLDSKIQPPKTAFIDANGDFSNILDQIDKTFSKPYF